MAPGPTIAMERGEGRLLDECGCGAEDGAPGLRSGLFGPDRAPNTDEGHSSLMRATVNETVASTIPSPYLSIRVSSLAMAVSMAASRSAFVANPSRSAFDASFAAVAARSAFVAASARAESATMRKASACASAWRRSTPAASRSRAMRRVSKAADMAPVSVATARGGGQRSLAQGRGAQITAGLRSVPDNPRQWELSAAALLRDHGDHQYALTCRLAGKRRVAILSSRRQRSCTLPLVHVNPYRRSQSRPHGSGSPVDFRGQGTPGGIAVPRAGAADSDTFVPPLCSARSSPRGLGRRTEPRDEPADPPHDVGMTDHTAIADNPTPHRHHDPPRTTLRPCHPRHRTPAHDRPPRHPHPRRPTEQPQGRRPRPPFGRTSRRHWGQRLRQVVAGLRHRLQRRPAPLRRDLLLLRPPVPRPYGQAPRGRHRRHPPGHRHRPDQSGADLALHRRHHDRAQRPSEAAVHPRRGPALPGLRGGGAPRHAGVHPGRAARRRSRPGDGDLRGEGPGGGLPDRADRAAGEPGLHPGAPRAPGPHRGHPGPHRGHPGPLPARRWRARSGEPARFADGALSGDGGRPGDAVRPGRRSTNAPAPASRGCVSTT